MSLNDGNWLNVAELSEINSDTNMLRVTVSGEPVCIYKLEDDSIYATHDTCTHSNASLSEGYVEDGVIECPLHQGCFDIKTGKAVAAPCKVDIKTFRTKVVDGSIYVEKLDQ